MRGRFTSLWAAFDAARGPQQRRAVFALVLLVLGAGPARGQTTTGHLPADFGAVPVGTAITRAVLTLTPATDTVIDSITVTGPNAGEFAVTAGGCGVGSTVTAGTQCAVSITFTPAAGGCRQALLRVASHDAATNQTFLDVAALIGAGDAAAPAGTIPLVMPLSLRLQDQGLTFTPIAGTPESTFTVVNPTILASRGGLSQATVAGTLITADAGTPIRSVALNTQQYTGQFLHGTGQDTLVLCAVATVVPGAGGLPVVEEIFYVASGTGRFAGATGTGRITHSLGPGGEQLTDITGTITLRIPTGPFAYIYLADLLRSY
jgi:hypothetical protein